MESLRIILRMTHILSGTLWIGAAVFLNLFLHPTIQAAGAEGGRVMERLVTRTPVIKYMVLSSLLTVVSGVILYGLNVGFNEYWIMSREGVIFSVGAAAGMVAYITGQFVIAPTSQRMSILGQEMAMAGGPPSSVQLTEMSSLQARAMRFGQLEFVLMLISVAGMAGARLF
jgi:hypothetical protein